MLRKEAAGLRRDYAARGLSEADAHADPMAQFEAWYGEALDAGMLLEPNAMTLATASPEGRPSARVVLLKDFDARGFAFFTNYDSRKGRELASNPYAALCFWWDVLERQVRVEGRVEQVEPDLSDAYFASRPLGSRLGAWASRQSSVLAGRAELEARLAEMERQYAGGDVPRPPHWGGYRLRPDAVEFWQGRPGRLHDRILYTLQPQGSWRIERLSP